MTFKDFETAKHNLQVSFFPDGNCPGQEHLKVCFLVREYEGGAGDVAVTVLTLDETRTLVNHLTELLRRAEG